MTEEIQPVKLCILCGQEMPIWKKLFCSDVCYRVASAHNKLERDYILSETQLTNEIIKLEELLGKKKVVLDECQRQLAEECRLELSGYKN